jgi:DNA repair exonuclease SbcCD ATPase subunit
MVSNRVVRNGTGAAHYYYRCPTRQQRGQEACPSSWHHRADKLESLVWAFIRDLLADPGRLRAGFDNLIEREHTHSRNGSEGASKTLHKRLEEIAHKRARAQDLTLDGLLTREELRAKLSELDEAKEAVEKELAAYTQRAERLKTLEQDRDATLAAFVESVPEELDRLAPEERHRIYKMLRLRINVEGDGQTEISGALTGSETVCKNGGRGW